MLTGAFASTFRQLGCEPLVPRHHRHLRGLREALGEGRYSLQLLIAPPSERPRNSHDYLFGSLLLRDGDDP